MTVHAYQMGPAKDLSRARTGRHGSLRVEGRTLLFVGHDLKQISISLDRGDDMIALAEELKRAGRDAKLTDTVTDLAHEEFIALKVLP